MSKAKPFCISKQVVWEAYKHVKARKGTYGIDGQSMEMFETKLKDNLYKLWNRMSSGSYFPSPVRRVSIPKRKGGERVLGIPTVEDRIAQVVVARYLEPEAEPKFRPDSYGYRPGKSMKEALGVARQRCWKYDWVLDLDVKGFFDNLDHELTMRAVKRFTDCRWVLLYVERWLKAPVQQEDGAVKQRDKGTPQGSAISPMLSNIFLHLAFDQWMHENHPQMPFERYADDVIVHCRSRKQAELIKDRIAQRLARCKLELNPEKTQIVYCKDGRRTGDYPVHKFDFLGYTFRPRQARSREGEFFLAFTPAVSQEARTRMQREMKSWRLHLRSGSSLDDLAKVVNPVVRGWINHYGQFRRSEMYPVYRCLNRRLTKWASRKYKKLKRRRRAERWLGQIAKRQPDLFAHWKYVRHAAG